MLPPPDDAVLKANPEFAALYNTLTTVLLNPDGSSKHEPDSKQREAVRKELREYRLRAARRHLLVHAICHATASDEAPQPKPKTLGVRRPRAPTSSAPISYELPDSLLDLLQLLPAFLSDTSLTPEATALLLAHPPFSDFTTHLPHLTPLVGAHLQASAAQLARLANPTTNPSYIHRAIPGLPAHITGLQDTLATQKAALAAARRSVADGLAGLLAAHAAVLTHLLRALEAKHGPVARSLELRAGEAALGARTAAAEAEILLWGARRDVYTPEVREALGAYAAHLRDATRRLEEGVRGLTEELSAYGVEVGDSRGDKGKERTLREMARVYRDMGQQVEEARKDLGRLGKA